MALPEDVNNEEEENDFFDIAGDVLAAPFRGIEGAFQGAYNLADYLAFDVLPDYDTRFLGTSKTMAGGAVEGITQFATGFIPLFGLAGRAGAAAKAGSVTQKALTTTVPRAAIAGAATDFTFFNGQEARLSNLIQQVPELQNPVTEFLAYDGDEGELEGRMKNVLEGLGLEAVAGVFIKSLKAMKKARKVKEETGDAQKVADSITEDLAGEIAVPTREAVEELEGPAKFAAYDESKNPEWLGSMGNPYYKNVYDEELGYGVYMNDQGEIIDLKADTPIFADKTLEQLDQADLDKQLFDTTKQLEDLEGWEDDRLIPRGDLEKIIEVREKVQSLELEDWRRTVDELASDFDAEDPFNDLFGKVLDEIKRDNDVADVKIALAFEAIKKHNLTDQFKNFLEGQRRFLGTQVEEADAEFLFKTQMEKAVNAYKKFSKKPVKQVEDKPKPLPEYKPNKQEEFLSAVPEKFRDYASELLKGGKPRLPQFALETDGDVVVLKDLLEKYYEANPEKVTVTDAVTDIDEAIEKTVRAQAKEGEDAEKVLRDIRITQQAYREQGKALIQNVSEIAEEAFANGYGDVSITKLKNAFQQLLTVADVYRRIGRETAITLQARREGFGKRKLGLNEAETAIEGIRKEFVNNSGNMKPEKMVKLVREHVDPNDLEGSLSRLLKTAKKAQGKSFLDMPTEYWMNSILSGPKTQMVNIMGNALTQVMTTIEAVAGGVMSGNMDVVRAVMASWSDGEMFKEAAKFSKQAFKDQDNLLDPTNRAFEEGQKRAITSERFGGIESDAAKQSIDAFGNAIRIPSRLLLTTDEFFKQLAYRRAARFKAAMSGLQQGIRDPKDLARHINNTVDTIVTESGRMMSEEGLVREATVIADKKGLKGKEKADFIIDYKDKNFNPDASGLAQYALDEAQYLTFTKELQDRTLGKGLQEITNKVPFLRFILPFVRTPTNILKFAAERTPFAVLLRDERRRFIEDYKSGDPARIARANGKSITGALTAGVMIDVAHNNREYITGGGPSNEREKEALMATGWRPYSIKIGDTYYSYQKLDPIATILGIAADIVETGVREEKAFDETGLEHATNALVLSLTRNFTNKSYLAGIQMWADALGDPDRYVEKLGRNYVSSFVPNVLSQMADYDTQAVKETRSIMDAVKRKIGLRGSLDTKRNILGEEYKMEQWMGTGFINPIAMSTKKDDPILNEMASLNHAFRNPPPSLGGQIDMLEYENDKGQSAYDRQLELLKTVKMRGLTLRQSLNKLIKSKSYQRLSSESEPGLPSPRIQQINSILTRYRKEARRQMLREYPELDRQYAALTRAKAGFRTGMQREDVLELLAQ